MEPFAADMIVLKMPGKWGDKDTRLLAGRRSPVGHILTDAGTGGLLAVQFKASEVLAWLDEMEGKDLQK